jgi:hypothetical protein
MLGKSTDTPLSIIYDRAQVSIKKERGEDEVEEEGGGAASIKEGGRRRGREGGMEGGRGGKGGSDVLIMDSPDEEEQQEEEQEEEGESHEKGGGRKGASSSSAAAQGRARVGGREGGRGAQYIEDGTEEATVPEVMNDPRSRISHFPDHGHYQHRCPTPRHLIRPWSSHLPPPSSLLPDDLHRIQIMTLYNAPLQVSSYYRLKKGCVIDDEVININLRW